MEENSQRCFCHAWVEGLEVNLFCRTSVIHKYGIYDIFYTVTCNYYFFINHYNYHNHDNLKHDSLQTYVISKCKKKL